MNDIKFCKTIEQWCVWEVAVNGKKEGNPYVDFNIFGEFVSKSETKKVEGFYDGDGIYRIRFMPSYIEEYQFNIIGSAIDTTYKGAFVVTKAQNGNHGKVKVANQFHFAYEDGTPYYSIGTTCYAWIHQSEKLQSKTLQALSKSPFNKIRFCIFPKHYWFNYKDPIQFPYEGTPVNIENMTPDNFKDYDYSDENQFDCTKFVPEFYRSIEKQLQNLMDMSIEADIIIFHPYDRWRFSYMTPEENDLYLHYIVARFAAYRNVWWSLANEFDLMQNRTIEEWEHYGNTIKNIDPYDHLRSIHNWRTFYDHTKDWITHCSIQRTDYFKPVELSDQWRSQYQKPVVIDELCYEGNIYGDWGNITGEDMVRRFWQSVCRGCYAGHGETFENPEGILWWSHGGDLHGESAPRLEFLLQIMNEIPGHGLKLRTPSKFGTTAILQEDDDEHPSFLLCYFDRTRPMRKPFYIDDETEYQIELIDTWDMTITDMGTGKGKFEVPMPGKTYMAIRLTAKIEK